MIRHWRNREGSRAQEKGCMHGPARRLPPSQQQGSSVRRKARGEKRETSGSSLRRKTIGERREGLQAPVSRGRL